MRCKESSYSSNEKLGSIRVRASVGHGEKEGHIVLELEGFIRELLPVDRLATGSIAAREVAALNHEVLDNAMQRRALVVQRLPCLAYSFLARAERTEVLSGLGHCIVVELHHDTASWLAADADIEEDAWTHHSTATQSAYDVREIFKDTRPI